jgi:hypothetical protein
MAVLVRSAVIAGPDPAIHDGKRQEKAFVRLPCVERHYGMDARVKPANDDW